MWSVAQTLDQLTARLPPALLTGEGLARARLAAAHLPARLTNCLYLEWWPPDGAARTDLIVRLDTRGRACLADHTLSALDAPLRAAPAWQRIATFARAWAVHGDLLDRHVEGAWIELDLDPAVPEPWLRPRLFVDFATGARAPRTREASLALARHIAYAALGGPLPPDRCEQLRACVMRLPEGAALRYLGLTPDRPDAGLRLCVSRLGESWRGYLEAIRWPGDPRGLDLELVAPIRRARGAARPAIDLLHVDLDRDRGVSARLGLEYAFARPSQMRGRVQEAALLDLLVSRGWCDESLRDAALDWPGRAVDLLPHEIWHSQVSRRVSHVKFAYAPGAPLVMKTYFCVFFELLAGGTLLGGRPWQAAAETAADAAGRAARNGAEPLRNSAPARSPDAAIGGGPRDVVAPPMVAREGTPGSEFAPRTRE